MVKNYKAFSLAEAMVAMMIMALVGAATMSIISKAKPRIETTTIRGQYGCWIQNGKLYEQYFDERNPRSNPKPAVSNTCKFNLDRRPGHFYVLATAAGNGSYGQHKSIYSATLSNKLDITVNSNVTRVESPQSSEPEIEVYSQIDPKGLNYENLSECTLSTAGAICPDGHKDSDGNNYIQTGCSAGELTNNMDGTVEYGINIACAGDDQSEVHNAFYPLSDIELNNAGNSIEVAFATHEQAIEASKSNHNNRTYRITDTGGASAEFYFSYKDSSIVPSSVLVGMETNGGSGETQEDGSTVLSSLSTQYSPFTRILNLIPPQRETTMIKTFKDLNQQNSNFGNNGKPGAVIILW